MIIKEKKKREPLAYLFTILFFINYFFVFQQAQWLHKIDTVVYFKLTRNLNNLQVMFYNVISELSSSRMAIVYTIVLLGILWFIRWQIPSVWITFTVGTGLVVGWVARLILRYGSKRVEPEMGCFPRFTRFRDDNSGGYCIYHLFTIFQRQGFGLLSGIHFRNLVNCDKCSLYIFRSITC